MQHTRAAGDPFALIRTELTRVEAILQEELTSPAPFVDDLLRYVASLGGKRLRPALLLLTAHATGTAKQEHELAAAVMEMIHLATLVHDDVLDNAATRRHRETVYRRWGSNASILLGDHLFSRAFHLASTLGDTFACRTIGQSTNIVCEGELMQLGHVGKNDLTEEQYLSIVKAKTAELCACCCRLGAYYAGASDGIVKEMSRFGSLFGMAFQIVDDILDVTGDTKTMGKDAGADWRGRQLTLPFIHYQQQHANGTRHAMEMGVPSPTMDGEFSRWRIRLEQSGSIDYARRRAKEFSHQAELPLAALPASAARDSLTHLCQLVLTRVA